MKSTIWYSAAYDEIWLMEKPNRVIRGVQATIRPKFLDCEVRDYLDLFYWPINEKTWQEHKKLGWLIRLGDL